MTKNTRKGRDLGDWIADFIMSPIGMIILLTTTVFLIIKIVSLITAFANNHFGLTLTWLNTFVIITVIVFIGIMVKRAVSGKAKEDSKRVLDRLKSLFWLIMGLGFVVLVVYVGVVGIGVVFRISGLIFNLVLNNFSVSLITGVLVWVILARTKMANTMQYFMIIGGTVLLMVFVISTTRMLTLQRPTAPTDFAADVVRLPIAIKGLIGSYDNQFLFVLNPAEKSSRLYVEFEPVSSLEGKWVYEHTNVITTGSLEKSFGSSQNISQLPWEGKDLRKNKDLFTPKFLFDLPITEQHIHKRLYVTVTIDVIYPDEGGGGYYNKRDSISRKFGLYVITPEESEIISEYQSRFEVWNTYNKMTNGFPGILGMIIGNLFSFVVLMIGAISLSKDVKRDQRIGMR